MNNLWIIIYKVVLFSIKMFVIGIVLVVIANVVDLLHTRTVSAYHH